MCGMFRTLALSFSSGPQAGIVGLIPYPAILLVFDSAGFEF